MTARRSRARRSARASSRRSSCGCPRSHRAISCSTRATASRPGRGICSSRALAAERRRARAASSASCSMRRGVSCGGRHFSPSCISAFAMCVRGRMVCCTSWRTRTTAPFCASSRHRERHLVAEWLGGENPRLERNDTRNERPHSAFRPGLVSWRDLAHTLIPILAISALAIAFALHFASPAPPRELTMSSGPPGSSFDRNAERYRTILARSGVTLHVVRSQGAVQNLARLLDRHSHVDIAFVQSGLPASGDTSDLVSLGSMFYEPLTIFYRSPRPLERLSALESHRIAIGPEGSGTRILALALLQANGIAPQGSTRLLSLQDAAAKDALLKGQVDAIFLGGDSASTATMRELLHTPGIRLFDFKQANA